jgi:hypothetical protein
MLHRRLFTSNRQEAVAHFFAFTSIFEQVVNSWGTPSISYMPVCSLEINLTSSADDCIVKPIGFSAAPIKAPYSSHRRLTACSRGSEQRLNDKELSGHPYVTPRLHHTFSDRCPFISITDVALSCISAIIFCIHSGSVFASWLT